MSLSLFLNFSTISKIDFKETLFLRARSWAFCIIGPSAIGSVKGTPISIMSTPDSTSTVINSRVVSISGSPATRYATRAFLLLFFNSSKVFVSLFKSLFHQYLQQC